VNPLIINSDNSLQNSIGIIRELYQRNRYLKVNIKIGKSRSLDQNAILHAWIEQIARELREDDALGWKSYIKLHLGVPILRAEDEQFREAYDQVIKPLGYEKKLIAMKCWPVSSIMTKPQLSALLEATQADFLKRGVKLEFPEDEK
jgi:hypothetical protein